MKKSKSKKLTADLLDAYYHAKTMANRHKRNAEKFSKEIKSILLEEQTENLTAHGYSLELKTRLQPNVKLAELLCEKGCLDLLTITCSSENLEKIWEVLGNPNEEEKASLLTDSGKKCKFLHVTEEKKKK